MYCRECGSHVNSNAEICTSCGVRPLNGVNYCQQCGSSTKPEQELCIKCGTRLQKLNGSVTSTNDNPSGIVNLVACCFPIVGLILYIVWKNEKPKSASSVCKWTISGFVISIVLYVIGLLLGALSEL